MKVIATKTNPAFKVAQPLPLWPVSSSALKRGAAVSSDSASSPKQTVGPPEKFDPAVWAIAARPDFCQGVSPTN